MKSNRRLELIGTARYTVEHEGTPQQSVALHAVSMIRVFPQDTPRTRKPEFAFVADTDAAVLQNLGRMLEIEGSWEALASAVADAKRENKGVMG